MKSIKYTPYGSETSYTGQYPPILEFDRLKEYIKVGQGDGKISLNGRPLESEGFGQCFGVILRNRDNLESALFHVSDLDLNTVKQTILVEELMKNHIHHSVISDKEREELLETLPYICKYNCPSNYGKMTRKEFQRRMEKLNKNKIIQARFIGGDSSRIHCRSRIEDSLFNYLGIQVKDDILVDTGGIHWDLLYKPNEEDIYVNSRKQDKVLTFKF